MCSPGKYPYPTMEGIGNSGGEGGQKKNKITVFVWKKNGSSGGEGGPFTNSLLGGIWIFFGTIQCHRHKIPVLFS